MSRLFTRRATAVALTASLALVLASCADTSDIDAGSGDGAEGLIIGTSDSVTALDPAGSYDNGSYAVQIQVFPYLMAPEPGSPDVSPDIAESGEFTSPTQYTVKLKPDLKWANDNPLTSSDVKFSYDRQLKINDPNGPSSLLYNLESVEAPDDTTVVFNLKSENDQTFPQVLSSPVGPIVDEDVFSADAVTDPQVIVDGKAFGGQYVITDFQLNESIRYEANPNYAGMLDAPKMATVTTQYFTDQTSLKLAAENGDIDVAYRSLSPTDVEDLEKNDKVTVHHGPGGEIRYMVFNMDTMPFGAKTPEADAAKATAVRQAMADLLDREAISTEVYKGTYSPLYSPVPDGMTGAITPMKDMYGDGQGGPDGEKAAKRLADAGVQTPVEINLQYSPDHYGASSDDEYALVKSQLEEGGLFKVNLASTVWTTYTNEYAADGYPVFQLGWFPDFSDADNYLSPFFLEKSFMNNHYLNQEVIDTINAQATELDPEARAGIIEKAQELVAADLPTLPFLQGDQIAVAGKEVKGVEDTLDPSFRLRYGLISK